MIRRVMLVILALVTFNSCQKDGFYISKPVAEKEDQTDVSFTANPSGTTYNDYHGLYVDSTSSIIGDTVKENGLLRWCLSKNINTLSFYDLRQAMSPVKAGYLARFLKLAKTKYGIKENTAVVGSDAFISSYLDTFNRSKADTLERFNTINLEREWWNGDGTFKSYVKILTKLKQWGQSQTPMVKTEEYIGWFVRPSGKELYMANELVKNSERILVHVYQQTLSFQYILSRLSYLGQAAKSQGKIFPVVIIFSAELNFSADYFRIYDFEDAYGIITSGYLNSDFPGKENIKLVGYQIFDYSYAKSVKPMVLW